MPINKDKLAYSLLLLFMFSFILIVLKGLVTAQPGDENVYYYMGKLISEGNVPYRDFFFAHPPLHTYLIALIYKISGFNIIVLKLIPLISTLITAFFIFKIAKGKFGNLEALMSSLLFLFSYSVMFNSVFSFGVNLATMFLVVGVYFLFNKVDYAVSGIFFGLAGVTRLLTLLPISIFLIAALFSNRKNFLKLLSGFLAIFVLVNGSFALFFGNDYITPVYKFHLLKSLESAEKINEYSGIIKLNWILFSSALLFVFLKDKKQLSTFVIVSFAYLIFLTTLKKIFGFYFIITLPFLALVGGCSIVHMLKRFDLTKRLKTLISILLLSIFTWNLVSDILFLERIGFSGFARGKELVDFIELNSGKNTQLFGDDSVVPLLALLTNKNIALYFADTNNQVFISGAKNLSNVLAGLNGKEVLFVIRSRQGISYFKEVRDFLSRNCEFLSQFHDKLEGDYLVYRCK